ncbi:C40 family peptidase [Flavobacterium sp. NG2]|uniref:C40 family peptidase n=1 Tax=Flavobacterium sp. NG2 TaxID=3097547 RepID=UPI002A83C716|nr:C40 family peptidase [Flavobacterium sp. NG2]WPR72553.1 C40 family peptidase [Flavobacterium sp. NG2]
MKKIIPILLCIVLFASCKSTSKIVTKKSNTLADQIIDTAIENIGVPYKMAGTTKAGFDCSGLVYNTFGQFDIKLPRTSYDQAKTGIDLGKNTSKAQKGDLIFFKTNNSSRINHVGIITEANDDEIKFIHSSTSRGVIISSTKESYYQKSFTQLNRVLE